MTSLISARKKHLLFILGLFSSVNGLAKNGAIATAVNQIEKRQYCWDVSVSEIRSVPEHCSKIKALNDQQLSEIGHDAFDWLVYQEAARLQFKKNRCLAAQITELQKPPEFKKRENDDPLNKTCNSWKNYLFINWVRQRKAKLLYTACKEVLNLRSNIYQNYPEIPDFEADATFKKLIKEGTWRNGHKISKEKLNQFCGKEKLDLLYTSIPIFQLGVPVVATEELFNSVTKNRQDIVYLESKSDGSIQSRPMTDEDILLDKLDTWENIDWGCEGRLNQNINLELRKISAARSEVNSKLLAVKDPKNDIYELSENQIDFIYNDDTVWQTLSDHDLLNAKEFTKGVKETLVNQERLSNGAACLFSQHEPNLKGELLDMAVKSAGEGALLYKLLSGLRMKGLAAQFIPEVKSSGSMVRDLKKALGLGLGAEGLASTPSAGWNVLKTCFDLQEPNKEPGLVKRRRYGNINELGSHVPKEIGFMQFDQTFKGGMPKECDELKDHDWMKANAPQASCIMEGLDMVLPLHLSLALQGAQ